MADIHPQLIQFLDNQNRQLALLETQLAAQESRYKDQLAAGAQSMDCLQQELVRYSRCEELDQVTEAISAYMPNSEFKPTELSFECDAVLWCHQEMQCLVMLGKSPRQHMQCFQQSINQAFASGFATAGAMLFSSEAPVGHWGHCVYESVGGLPCVLLSGVATGGAALANALVALAYMWQQQHPTLQDMLKTGSYAVVETELARLDDSASELCKLHQALSSRALKRRSSIKALVANVETDEQEMCEFLKVFDDFRQTVDKTLPQLHKVGRHEDVGVSRTRRVRRDVNIQVEAEGVVAQILSHFQAHGKWPRRDDLTGLSASRARTLGGFRCMLQVAQNRAS
jgi:hypothetical protein